MNGVVSARNHGILEAVKIIRSKVENLEEAAKFDAWSKANTKPCPNCKAGTQKNDGCNHMTCSNCKHQWCWICNGQYTPNHFDKLNVLGCPGMQFTEKNNDIDVANSQYMTAVGKQVLLGAGITLAIPLGIALGAVGVILAAPVALVGGAIYGGMRIADELKK